MLTGGWNNNPSTYHFKAAFRALISRCGAAAISGETGNCVSQEAMEMVKVSSYASPFTTEENSSLDAIEDDFSAIFSSDVYAILAQNIVTYICGWVVKTTLKKTKCDECRYSLCKLCTFEPSSDERFHFLHLKNRGGLMYPSEGVLKVATLCETFLRADKHIALLKLQLLVLERLGTQDIFFMGDHIMNTTVGIDNHFFCLIKRVVSTYYNVRQHHIARLLNQKVHAKNVRHKNTKNVLFLGQ